MGWRFTRLFFIHAFLARGTSDFESPIQNELILIPNLNKMIVIAFLLLLSLFERAQCVYCKNVKYIHTSEFRLRSVYYIGSWSLVALGCFVVGLPPTIMVGEELVTSRSTCFPGRPPDPDYQMHFLSNLFGYRSVIVTVISSQNAMYE